MLFDLVPTQFQPIQVVYYITYGMDVKLNWGLISTYSHSIHTEKWQRISLLNAPGKIQIHDYGVT